KTRCSALQRRSSSLTTPSLLSRGSLNCGGLKNTATQGGPARPQHASQINNTALDEFGQALHTAADRTSPAHTDANGDPRDWNGIPVTPGQVAAVQEHEAEEANPTPEQFGGAAGDTHPCSGTRGRITDALAIPGARIAGLIYPQGVHTGTGARFWGSQCLPVILPPILCSGSSV